MKSLTICLPIHPMEVLSLDEDTCADLVNRFGRNLRQLLSLYVVQSSKTGVLSSDFRDGCLNTYCVSVTLDQSVLGLVPDVLDDSRLTKLGRAVGDDFDDIRKLSRDQLFWFLQWLEEAKMIESFEIEELSGNYNTDLSLCTPPASIEPTLLTNDHTLSSPENFRPHAVGESDLIWDQIIDLPEDQSNTEFAILEHVSPPMGSGTSPISNALTYPTPHSVDSPRVGGLVAPTSPTDEIMPYWSTGTPLSVNSPYSSLAMTPTGPATPFGPDATPSSYPTPSTYYIKLPPAVESHTLQGPRISDESRSRCLQLCRVVGKKGTEPLEGERINQILKAEDCLLTQDPFRLLQPLLGCSEADNLSSLNALGLPVEWRGKEGAVEYYRLLEAVKKKTLVLSRLAKHIALILFYLNLTWLEKHGDLGVTVATFILAACPEEPNLPKLMKSRRDNITTLHKRQGQRCWMLVACLGAGVLLHGADTIDAVMNKGFRVGQLNAFITFVLRTRPGTVHLLRSLDPVIKAIMHGVATADLRQVVLGSTNAFFRQEELACAFTADQEAWTGQMTEEIWQAVDVESIAEEKISDILPDF